MRVALVSCVKSKRTTAAPAKDLYISALFQGLRRYAEVNADAWYILSAEHGLLNPEQIVEPYEKTLNKMGYRQRLEWAEEVQRRLLQVLPEGTEVLVLAGQRYREHLVPFLRDRGFSVSIPLEGLSFGRQLRALNSILND
jgi:uncharacterized protein DUF6884